jgi:glycosyltransferase involved in cell wall biosynthesis
MKILFVVPYTPNPIRVRPYELLRTLVRRGHTVTLATLWQNEQERHELGALAALGIEIIADPLSKMRSLWNCVQALPSQAPLQAAYCWQPHFARQLYQVAGQRRFDVIHVEHLRGARYGLALKEALAAVPGAPPIVWDSVDCISYLFAQAAERSRSRSGRLMTTVELARTRRYEGWLLRQFDQVLVTSPNDRQALLALAKPTPQAFQTRANEATGQYGAPTTQANEPVAVLPNGVDLESFRQDDQPKAEKTLVFSGKMSYHANVTAALYLVQEIMPQVWAHDPAVRVQLVGKDPPAPVRALADATTAPAGAVEVTGAVPTMRPYLSQATMAVAPVLYGAGIQNKVLEAMACGTPVIASPSAASGLQAKRERDLIVADDADAFATAILSLLAQPARRAQIGQAGRAFVEQIHSWDAVGAQLEQYYQATMRETDRTQ